MIELLILDFWFTDKTLLCIKSTSIFYLSIILKYHSILILSSNFYTIIQDYFTFGSEQDIMFDETIKALRKNRGLSQVDLAKDLHVTKQCISNWENGNIAPSVDMLIKIARYFSVSTDYLLGIDNRRYIETTGLTDRQITHIQQIIGDILESE